MAARGVIPRGRPVDYVQGMPNDLYDHDALAWSEQQAALLRRVARGERVNGVDWEHVVEEIEDVGLSELNSVCSYLRQMLVHLLKVRGWPDSSAVEHWCNEVVVFQAEAAARFSPSMRQRIDVAELHKRSLRLVRAMRMDGRGPGELPERCPFALDDLLTDTLDGLLETVRADTRR